MLPTGRILLFYGLAAIAVIAIAAAYWPGLSSSVHFDDRNNLDGLSAITDHSSALAFVLSNAAGPTGRPLSLLSFVPQAGYWPEDPRPLLATNIAIHLLNGLLVGILTWLVSRETFPTSSRTNAPWAAWAAATIWLALPLLASSSLFIVQRMTTLAAFFVLFGLCLHLLGRQLLPERPRWAFFLMTVGAFTGLGLGIHAKENAVVYPLLVLALDRTFLAQTRAHFLYKIWRIPFIIVPAFLLCTYLLWLLFFPGGYDTRHFDLGDRLLTQGVALFHYLYLMLIPNTQSLGPFHDHYPILGGVSLATAMAAAFFWITAAIISFTYGRRYPAPAFAVLWYLSAHLIESTWVPLELYFEHRNYLPSVGVVLALVVGLGKVAGKAWRQLYFGFGLYAAVMVFSLIQVTSLWGHPRVAAEIWWDRDPQSVRAAEYLAMYHFSEQQPLIAARVLDYSASLDRSQLLLPLRSLEANCLAGESEKALALYASILERAPIARFVNRQASNESVAVERLLELIADGNCSALDYESVIDLSSAFLSNPVVRAQARTVSNYYVLKARAEILMGEEEATVESLMAALRANGTLHTARNAAELAHKLGRRDLLAEALRIIASRESRTHSASKEERLSTMNEIERLIGLLEKEQDHIAD